MRKLLLLGAMEMHVPLIKRAREGKGVAKKNGKFIGSPMVKMTQKILEKKIAVDSIGNDMISESCGVVGANVGWE